MDAKIPLLIILFINRVLLEQCSAQDEQCVPLHACPKVFDTFSNPPTGSEEYLRRFLCKGDQELHVCCDSSSNITVLTDQHATNDTAYTKLLTRHAFFKSYGGPLSDAVLPVVLAKTVNSDQNVPKCFGALINNRYVIATAKCVVANSENQKITHVRFSLQKKKSYMLAIEEKISHPFYDPVTGVNDLALLRLNETISEGKRLSCYTIKKSACIYHLLEDGVTPSSIHNAWDNDYAKPGLSLITYERLNISATSQWQTKMQTSTKLLSEDVCKKIFHNKTGNTVIITDYNPCTDFKPYNAYTGVPLFYKGYYDDLIGISTQRTLCPDGLPNIYTNVALYKEWLLNNMRPWPIYNEQCTTPGGEEGVCMYIQYCPLLSTAFVNANKESEEYLTKFICKERKLFGDIFVCCPTSSSFSLENNSKQQGNIDGLTRFLENELCGMQHRDDYISSSTTVAIDEFPWIGLIHSRSRGQYRGRCTATLINARYVLTVAICAQTLGSEAIVRLGDYSWTNETDCIVENVEFNWMDCSETQIFGIEEVVVNPFFREDPLLQRVALLRLNKTVLYTDFIRPICLPVRGTPIARLGDSLYLSSWGYKEEGPRKAIKKKILTKIITSSQCRRMYRKHLIGDLVDDFTLCASDYENNTEFISALDEGGALMMDNNYRWHIQGLLHTTTINRNIPKVYGNVSRYTDWILNNMRPWW